jgi:capsular polysaccharide biosynthesis protein
MVDTAEAIVTSPSYIESALDSSGIDRDPATVVDQVDIESVGVSGVLVVSAEDADPEVATALADAMADQLVTARRELLRGPLQERLNQLDDELATAGEDIERLNQQLNEGGDVDSLSLQLQEAIGRQSDIRNERETLSESLNIAPSADVLGAASTPDAPQPTAFLADLVVAALLGLILGVALAAVIEAVRPTIVSGDALSRVLGAPLLGRIPNPARGYADPEDVVATRLGMVISRARLDVIHLTGVTPTVDMGLLRVADELQAAVPRVAVEVVGAERDTTATPVTRTNRARHGLVVVAPEVLPRDALSGLEHLLVITQWPLVGIIAYRCPLWTRFGIRDDIRSLRSKARSAMTTGRRGRAIESASGTDRPSDRHRSMLLPGFGPDALASSRAEAEA